MKLASFVGLAKDGAKATLIFVATSGSVNNEGIGAVFTGVVDNKLRAKG